MHDGDLGPDVDIKLVCPDEGVIGRSVSVGRCIHQVSASSDTSR
jgi:hypothetical protein